MHINFQLKPEEMTYTNKAVMEMHSEQSSSNGTISSKSSLNSLLNDGFCFWTWFAVETNPKLSAGNLKNNGEDDEEENT